MNLQKTAERLFVLINANLEKSYEEEGNMIMDVFLEEEFDMDQLKRMLLYLLEKVDENKREVVKVKIEQDIGRLEDARN